MKTSKVKTQYFSAKRLAMLAVLTAMALIMFMVESLFPPLFLPGAKMGLSNIFTLLAVILLGPVDAFVLVVVRTTLGSVFTGNVSTLMYSMSAGIVSVIVSSIMVEFAYPHVSIVAISVVSAVLHNLTQNVVFCLVSNTPQMFSYMPWLALLGVVAGIIVGFAVWFILRSIPVRTFALVLGVSEQDFRNAVEMADKNAPNATQSETETAAGENVANADVSVSDENTDHNDDTENATAENADGGNGSEQKANVKNIENSTVERDGETENIGGNGSKLDENFSKGNARSMQEVAQTETEDEIDR